MDDFATHRVPLDAAPHAYEHFQAKTGGTVKVLFQPGLTDPAPSDAV